MKHRSQLSKVWLVIIVQLLTSELVSSALASDKLASLEFDSSMLWGTPSDRSAADLSRFSEGNPIPAGNMKVDLYLNDGSLKTTDIYFMPVSGKKSAVACFTPADLLFAGILVEKLSEDSALWMRNEKSKSDCRVISTVVPGATATFDFSEQRLDLSIPQAFLMERPKDYVDPKQWDRGISAGRLNYSIDAFNATSNGHSDTQGFASLESGFNAGGWRVRNISSATSARSGSSFQAQRTYAQTDIERIKSTLTVGQNYTDGQIFNSYGLQGAFLSSDMRMLPPSMRSYAPTVKGTADSNAKVTIRQGNVVVYERAVPPGPFEISNLSTVGYGNDLEVTVTEADGSSKKFTVPYSPLVQLLRPGQGKYSASLGEAWSPRNSSYKPAVGQLTYQYGVNNALTASAGVITSEDYTALALGGALSTYVGGISADYTYANSRADSTSTSNGDSIRFVYSTLIEPTNTNITLSSYRYSSRGFWSFNELVANKNGPYRSRSGNDDVNEYFGAKQKGRFDVSLRQRLAPGYGNLFVSGSTRNFWNRKGSDTQYQVSYSNRIKELDYDVSATRVAGQDNRKYNEFRLNLTMPLFFSDSTRNYVSASAFNNSETGAQSQVQLGGIAGADQQYSYAVTTTQGLDSKNPQESYGLNGTYQGSKAFVSAGVTKGKDYQQTSLGLSGSVLAHAGGVTFGQTLGETVALVEAKDAQGARITNSSGATVDGQGYGVVPYLSAYSRNRIELDPEGLSRDVELKNTSSEAIPVAGSVIKIKFETSKESTLLINGKFADGKPLPFGAEVIDSSSKSLVGYVGQAGNIFARGVGAEGKLQVKLKDRDCRIDYKDPSIKGPSAQDAGVNSIKSINAVCQFE